MKILLTVATILLLATFSLCVLAQNQAAPTYSRLLIIEMRDGSVQEVELSKAKGAKICIEKQDGSLYEVDLKTVKKLMVKP